MKNYDLNSGFVVVTKSEETRAAAEKIITQYLRTGIHFGGSEGVYVAWPARDKGDNVLNSSEYRQLRTDLFNNGALIMPIHEIFNSMERNTIYDLFGHGEEMEQIYNDYSMTGVQLTSRIGKKEIVKHMKDPALGWADRIKYKATKKKQIPG